MWAEAGSQPDVEESLGIGGFGYPVCIHPHPPPPPPHTYRLQYDSAVPFQYNIPDVANAVIPPVLIISFV